MKKKIEHILERQFPLKQWEQDMKDQRRNPEIPVGTIARTVVEMVPRGQRSLLEVDQQMRLSELKAWHGSDRDMVVSDTTISRSLEGFAIDPIKKILWEMGRKVKDREMMKMKLPSGKKMRLGIVDGSQWGGSYGCVLTLAGRRCDVVAGYEMSQGRGHELKTTRKLLKETANVLGKGFVDVIAADGLYITKQDFINCRDKIGAHLLVKTKEEGLDIIKDASQLFYGNPGHLESSLEREKGFDQERMVTYEVTAAGGFQWQGVPVKVAHVKETFLKPKAGRPAETEYWVVTTDQTLSAGDLREIARLRWHIENRTFRWLSVMIDSKRRSTSNTHVQEALLGLWFIGLNLFGLSLAFTRMLSPDPVLRKMFQSAKKTLRWFTRLFERITLLSYISATS